MFLEMRREWCRDFIVYAQSQYSLAAFYTFTTQCEYCNDNNNYDDNNDDDDDENNYYYDDDDDKKIMTIKMNAYRSQL